MKNSLERLNDYQSVTGYILANFSHYCVEFGDVMVKKNIVEDIAKFNYIIGRMENYLTDKNDEENFVLMEEWFKREFDERDYSLSDFMQFVLNNSEEQEEEETDYERDSD